MTKAHIAIIGGGPAGLASSLALLSLGFSVSLLEQSEYQTFTAGEHLSSEAIPLLTELAIQPAVWQQNSLPCVAIDSSWGQDNLTSNESIFNPYGNSFILSRPVFDRQLAEQAKNRGARILIGASFLGAQWLDACWHISYRSGIKSGSKKSNIIKADFIIDASGRSATVAKCFKIRAIKQDNLIGIVVFLQAQDRQHPVSHSLLIESCHHGWWYSAPVEGNQLVATYMTDSDCVANFNGKPINFWQQALATSIHTKARVAAYNTPSNIHIRSARSQILEKLFGRSWLAVGDAAMSFDPLSSQGIQKGFYWGIQAAQTINDFFNRSSTALAEYATKIRDTFSEYNAMRIAYYSTEQRWTNSIFWQRRHLENPTSFHKDTPKTLFY